MKHYGISEWVGLCERSGSGIQQALPCAITWRKDAPMPRTGRFLRKTPGRCRFRPSRIRLRNGSCGARRRSFRVDAEPQRTRGRTHSHRADLRQLLLAGPGRAARHMARWLAGPLSRRGLFPGSADRARSCFARAAVIGQISNHVQPDCNMEGLPVCLKAGNLVVAETSSNRFGEFLMEYEPQGRTSSLRVSGRSIEAFPGAAEKRTSERVMGTDQPRLIPGQARLRKTKQKPRLDRQEFYEDKSLFGSRKSSDFVVREQLFRCQRSPRPCRSVCHATLLRDSTD